MIQQTFPLGLHWPTQEPFLFCAHHMDYYPEGNGQAGVHPEQLRGRNIGSDFEAKDGFRMYHGNPVPGFPVHPHRGFETITLVRQGFVDHADSMGAAGRYGNGDVQWMTAGKGVQHSEMFPLLHTDKKNTTELFQIWLNLPKSKKMTEPYFTMFWKENIPNISLDSGKANLTLIAGDFDGQKALNAPPESWASDPESEVAVWVFTLKKGAKVTLPATKFEDTRRSIYLFEGASINISNETLSENQGAVIKANADAEITTDSKEAQFLVLQARPLNEPVFQHGPFVMSNRAEIIQTIEDYQKTQFGGWPWEKNSMVHGNALERFAKFPDGKEEKPPSS